MRKQFLAAATCISMVQGCDVAKPTAPSTTVPTPSVQALSPTSVEGVVGGTAGVAPAIQLRDGKTGKPLAGATVKFFPVGSAVRNGSVVTGADGIASAGEWTFGTIAGSSSLSVWVNGVPRVSFTATLKADVPAMLFTPSSRNQMAVAGDAFTTPFVEVQDRFSNPLPNVEVTFTVVEGGGSVSEKKVTSTPFGQAPFPIWRLGENPGPNTLSIAVAGVEMLAFHVVAVDKSAVKWFVLDSLGYSNTKLSSPESGGISEARIGFISADACKCISEQGYFLRTLKFAAGLQLSSSGAYRRIDNTLYALDSGWESADIDGDRLVLTALDPWDGEYLLRWVYRSQAP